jgi:hypothetical protein
MGTTPRTSRRDRDADVVPVAIVLFLAGCQAPAGLVARTEPDAAALADGPIAPDLLIRDVQVEPLVVDTSPDEGAAPPGGVVCSATPAPPPFGLGFSDVVPGPTARITEAAPARLLFAFDTGATLAFAWRGPALEFWVGETERLERLCGDYRPGCWDVVRGSRVVAALWIAHGLTAGEADAPRAFPGGPALGLRRACVYPTKSYCSAAPTVWANVFDVEAEWQRNTTSIAQGTTGVAGPWRLTNITAGAGPGSHTPLCVQDGGFMVTVSLLGAP